MVAAVSSDDPFDGVAFEWDYEGDDDVGTETHGELLAAQVSNPSHPPLSYSAAPTATSQPLHHFHCSSVLIRGPPPGMPPAAWTPSLAPALACRK